MSRVCEITGKKAMVGNHVSFSNKKNKRTFNVNLMRKKFYIAAPCASQLPLLRPLTRRVLKPFWPKPALTVTYRFNPKESWQKKATAYR